MHSFSFQRWLLLVGKHWAENKKKYTLSVVAILGLIIFWFVFMMLTSRYDPLSRQVQTSTYFISLFAVGCLFASQFFSQLGSKTKSIFYLLTPASALEKLLCSLFYAVLIFFIVFTAVFYLADVVMVSVANAVHPYYQVPDGNGVIPKAAIANVFDGKGPGLNAVNISYYFLLLFFAVQSAFLLGSVYFSQYSFIKTAIVLFGLFIAASFTEGYLLHTFLPEGTHHKGLTAFASMGDGRLDKVVELSPWVAQVTGFLLCYAFAPLFWMVTYFRLTEKEV